MNKPSPLAIVVKIYNSDKEMKNTSASGLIISNMFRPLVNSCSIGEVIDIGRLVRDIKIGEILLFHHTVEADDTRLLERDDEGEYRIVMQTPFSDETIGVVKTKNGKSRILPMRGWVTSEPSEEDHINYEKIVAGVFQMPVSEFNPKDESIKGMHLAKGDWLVMEPFAAYEIEINRVTFWFLHSDSIIAVNKGCHKLQVPRHVKSENLHQISGEKLISLN